MADDLDERSEALGKKIDLKKQQLEAASPLLPSEQAEPEHSIDDKEPSERNEA